MSYKATIEYLYGLQKYGMKFGLDNITRLLSSTGEPQNSFSSIHVAGTNGKGSTCATIEAILRTAGVKTGLYTSPHLLSFTERIRIDGEEISEGDVVSLAAEARSIADAEGLCPTFFEVVTFMTFLHFRKIGVKWAVVETGLGGRLDATNVIRPEIAVITSIGLDHREFLGNTLREIAGEKAGIIKKNVPVISAPQPPEVLELLAQKAAEKDCPLYRYGEDFYSEMRSETAEGITFDFHGSAELSNLMLPLAGEHQIVNASLAIRTIELLSGLLDKGYDIRQGLAKVRWQGRIELIRQRPPVLIDGAHNPAAALALAKHLGKISGLYKRILLIIGIMADKDLDGILRELLPMAAEVICTAAAYGRAASPKLLSDRAASLGYSTRKAESVSEALGLAERLWCDGDIIVITGSFYTIGEAAEVLGAKSVLSRLRE